MAGTRLEATAWDVRASGYRLPGILGLSPVLWLVPCSTESTGTTFALTLSIEPEAILGRLVDVGWIRHASRRSKIQSALRRTLQVRHLIAGNETVTLNCTLLISPLAESRGHLRRSFIQSLLWKNRSRAGPSSRRWTGAEKGQKQLHVPPRPHESSCQLEDDEMGDTSEVPWIWQGRDLWQVPGTSLFRVSLTCMSPANTRIQHRLSTLQ